MPDTVDATRAGAFFAVFDVSHIQQTVVGLHEVEALARDRGMNDLATGVNQLILDFLIDLRALGVRYSEMADELIKRHIESTRAPNRPPSNEMETHIVSQPGPLGGVGIAKLDELGKIINTHDESGAWGAFWIAQEHGTGTTIGYGPGTGAQIPTQEGRLLYGTFYDSRTPPDREQRGLKVGRDQFFLPGGSKPGLGTISVDLPARHFLRDGTEETAAKWLAAIDALDKGIRRDLERLMAEARRTRTARAAQTVRHQIDV